MQTNSNTEVPQVMIVEDNALNLTLAKLLISKFVSNAIILEATNGFEAIEMLKSNQPDLIFMDVQMPDMNGIEATSIIRNSDNECLKKVPIIAMTAGVIKEDKDSCFAAGMNDFIAKPIDTKLLQDILIKYLPQNKIDIQKIDSVSNHFNKNKLLNNYNNEISLYKAVISQTLEDFPLILEKLNNDILNQNTSEIMLSSNRIKNISLNMYFIKMLDLTKEFEQNNYNIELFAGLFTKITNEWKYLSEVLKKEL